MVSLGWMNLPWMALFSLIIFAEKIWSRGLLAARMGGIIFMTFGLLIIIFAINGHIFIGVVGNNERNNNAQSMDMKGMMDMEKGSTDSINNIMSINNNNTTYAKR